MENHFPLHEDKQGNFGILVGYTPEGDKLLIPIYLADQIACQFAYSMETFRKQIKNRPKISLRQRLIKILGGVDNSK